MNRSNDNTDLSSGRGPDLAAARPTWLRFSLRSLLLVILAFAMLLGVWSSQVEPYRRQFAASTKITQAGGTVTARECTGSPWHRWLVSTMLGDEAFVDIVGADLSHQKVDDRTIEWICDLPKLQILTLDHCPIGNSSLQQLGRLRQLAELSLRYTAVSDDGMPWLAGAASLSDLRLTGTDVGDKGLVSLHSCDSLRKLYVRWTRVTDQGAQDFKKSVPACKVFHHAVGGN